MVILAKLIAILIFTIGLLFILNPQYIKSFLDFAKQGKRAYIGGVVRIVFGLVFLFAASDCRWSMVITIFGILFLIVGILFFVLGIEKIHKIIAWVEAKQAPFIRKIAIVPTGIGVLLFLAI